MLSMLARNWWALALRGLAAIIFGIIALVWPELTLLSLVLFFGAYALIDGIFGIINGISSYGERKRWWAILLEGLVSVVIGILTLIWPNITALTLLYVIAAWAIISGVLEIIEAVQLRKVIEGEWLMILSGIASAIFGILLIVFPGAGALSLTWLIGIYAIFFGIMLLVLAFRVRGMRNVPESGQQQTSAV